MAIVLTVTHEWVTVPEECAIQQTRLGLAVQGLVKQLSLGFPGNLPLDVTACLGL